MLELDIINKLYLELSQIATATTKHEIELKKEIEILTIALDESIKFQSHYAELLNMYDEGKRIYFKTSQQWIERLKEIKVIK